MMDKRKPPAAVRRTLRTEVGFACTIDGCGSPYLSYHHFDPQWSTRHHHEPEGMIALCLQHHKEADAGTYTKKQLRALKSSVGGREVKGRFNWKREKLLIIAGGNYFAKSPVLLEHRGKKHIWFEKDNSSCETINVYLYSTNGKKLFEMRNNDWLAYPRLDDIECPPSAKSLKVRSREHDVSLDLDFSNRSLEDVGRIGARAARDREKQVVRPDLGGFLKPLEQRIREHEEKLKDFVKTYFGNERITVCRVHLKINHPVEMHLTPTKISVHVTGNTVIWTGCFFPSPTAFSLGSEDAPIVLKPVISG